MARILLACEESQAVTIELRKLGHEAFSCDLLDCSGGHPEWHYKCDIFELVTVLDYRWDAIIGFPPCTHLAVSGAAHFEKKRGDGSQREAIEFFMNLWNLDCENIALENPVGILSGNYIKKYFPDLCEKYGLPMKPSQIIEPYYFGDEANKKTCLWIKGLPLLSHHPSQYSSGSKYIESPSGRRYPEWCWNTGGGSGHKRSKTFPGIARAMAEQWGNYLTNKS